MFERVNVLLGTFLCVAFLFAPPAFAKEILLSLVDQDGNAIQNAVVGFNRSKAASDSLLSDPLLSDTVMDQVNKQFLPHVLLVQKGQTVVFPNSDDIRHHIYSFSDPNQFEMRMFKGGESKSLAFDESGIVVLGCNIHDQMVGYIYVANEEQTALTNKDGEVTIVTDKNTIHVWHSRLSINHIERSEIAIPEDVGEKHTITLTLFPKKQVKAKRKFGSHKFSKGDN